jgi:hypothetical protein
VENQIPDRVQNYFFQFSQDFEASSIAVIAGGGTDNHNRSSAAALLNIDLTK